MNEFRVRTPGFPVNLIKNLLGQLGDEVRVPRLRMSTKVERGSADALAREFSLCHCSFEVNFVC